MAGKKRKTGVAPKGTSSKRFRNWIVGAAVILAIGGFILHKHKADKLAGVPADTVTVETSKGTFVMKLYPTLVPNTVENFRRLAEQGFYDGLKWHRVENWVVQTGDPTGTGRGGSDQNIALEINEKLSNKKGAVGMARSAHPDSASSQFYILRSDALSLDGNYAVFGYVVEGMDVIDKLEINDDMIRVTYERTSEKD